MLPVPSDRQHPPSPLDTIAAVLRGAVEAEVHPQWSVIGELRAALDGYETAIRLAAEARVAARVAIAIGLPAPEVPAPSEARRVLAVAMHAVAASALVFTEPRDAHGGGDGSDRRDTGREPLRVEPPRVDRAEHDAEPLVPAVVNGGGADVAVEVIDRDTEPPSAVENNGSAGKKNGTVLSQEAVRAYFEARAAAPPPSRPTSKYAQAEALRSLVRQVGQVLEPASDPDGVQELDALDEITADTSIWLSLSTPVQHLWLSYLVARARALKDWLHQNNPALNKRLHNVIIRLPNFSKEARPGHVNGMRPDHSPVRATWAADAQAFLGELRSLAFPERTAPVLVEQLSRPKAKNAKPRESAEPEPIEWPLRDRVARMRIVLFGGEPREEARQHLQRMLGIGTLDWPASDKPRRVDALAASIAHGKLAVLLVLRQYVAHKDSDKVIDAARARGIPFALVDSGYGIAAVREALETALMG